MARMNKMLIIFFNRSTKPIFHVRIQLHSYCKCCNQWLRSGISNEERVLFVYYDQMDTDEALVISIIETLIYSSSHPSHPLIPPDQFAHFSPSPPPPPPPFLLFPPPPPPPPNLAMEKELEVRCVNLWACRKLFIDLTLKLSRSDG